MAGIILHSLCSYSGEPPPPLKRRTISTSTKLRTTQSPNLHLSRMLCSYTEAGRMDQALSLFETVTNPGTFHWNMMIRGYTNISFFKEAIDFYQMMQATGVRGDNFTFPFVIKSCACLSSYDEVLKAHGKLMKVGLDSDIFICNSLIAFYSKLGLVDAAERVFDEMPARDIVSWNSMIDGYVSNGEGRQALVILRRMGGKPDCVGIMGGLAACSIEICGKQGKEMHCHVLRHGLERDTKLQTSLLDMYCKCREIVCAENVFNKMSRRNVVTWNVMIGGLVLNDQPHDAFTCMIQMRQDYHIDPDAVTMVNLLPACGQTRSLSHGKAIHGVAIRKRLLPHLLLQTALIDMYGKCAELRSAELLFNEITERSLVSWNTMITAYTQNDHSVKALSLFLDLLKGPLEPDAFTISSIISAYAELASLRHGKQIHSFAMKSGNGSNTYVLNSIVYMYAKCGDLLVARKMFDKMSDKNVVSWNTMIMGYAIHGQGRTALELFSEMKEEKLEPEEATFVSVLSACSLAGLVEEGWRHFDSMQQEYNITPQIEHYGCMIDLLGRSSDLVQAVDFIEKMPLMPTSRIWGSLLTASRNRNNIELAELAAERVSALGHDNTGCYILLSTMYAEAGRSRDVERVKSLMEEKGLCKEEARSLVELKSKTCSFINDDRWHDESYTIHDVSKILSRLIGEKANSTRRHSARLAVCFGLISSEVGTPVLIKKNVRVCNHCHQAIKLISRYSRREIIVGDSTIYHHFRDGVCCCGDYW